MKNKDDILNMVEREDVEFIRLQFTDMFGNLKNLAVTAGQLEEVLDNKYLIKGSAMFNDLIQLDEELYLRPYPDSFVILPWRPQQGKVGKLLCDVCLADGTDYALSSRTILKKVLAEAAAEGYDFYIDPECEFFIFHTDDYGMPTTVTHERAGYMDVGPVDFGENARRDMVLTLEDMGFEIESSYHEAAPAQHEIHFKEQSALQMADSLMTFKFAIRSVAKRFGLYATFMPKPKEGVSGSGMHLNITAMKDGHNAFQTGGAKKELSETARFFMGGIMAHAEALCAITNPIVNSYKRLGQGFDAPSEVIWSDKGEKALIKVRNCFNDYKLEMRLPDPSANPYLAIAVVIAAGMDGIRNKIDCGQKDGAGRRTARRLPENLKEAVTAIQKDKLLKEVLGADFLTIYADAKLNEWKEYINKVTDWEIENYLTRM